MPFSTGQTYPANVRAAYHEELTALTEQLGQMCGLAGVAMERATQALLQVDLLLAEQVITDHDQITAMSAQAAEGRSCCWRFRHQSLVTYAPSSAPSRLLRTLTGWVH